MLLHKNIYHEQIPITDWEIFKKENEKKDKFYEDGTIIWEGSGRNYDKSDFVNFREFLIQSNLILYAEGHNSAFGIGILDKNLNEFIKYSNSKLKNYKFTPLTKVDFIFESENIDADTILDIASLKELWGQGIEESYIVLKNIKITKDNLKMMSPDKNPTLKIVLNNGINLIKFRITKEEYENLKSDYGCKTINVIGKCEQNSWNNIITPQVIIKDYELAQNIEYYF